MIFGTRWLRLAYALLGLLLPPVSVVAQEYKADPRAAALVSRMTLEEKIDLLSGPSMMGTRPVPRLSIPSFSMTDGPVGAHIPPPSTAVGAGIGLAASWDPDLAMATGVQIGRDARSRGAHFLLGPGVNIYRSPLNGRNFEYFGEDPFLASRITVGYIKGVQSQGVGATVKHYLGNNSEYARHSVDSVIDEHTLHEIYLPAFEAAVKEGRTAAVMCAYNLTNEIHMCENGPLLSQVLKHEFGFDGLVVSDWFATGNGIASVNNGLDLEMPFGLHMNRQTLLPAVKSGQVSVATIDEHVERLLSVAFRFGWVDKNQLDLGIPRLNPDANKIALRNAEEGTVLLKNNGLLPLDAKLVKNIAVLGPVTYPAVPSAGGSGYVQPFQAVSLLEGISRRFSDSTVTYARGVKSINQLTWETAFHPSATNRARGVTVETFDSAFQGSPTSTRIESSMTEGSAFNSDPDSKPDYGAFTLEDLAPMLAPPKGGANQRWTGFLQVEAKGEYYAFVQTGSRFRLLVDDQLLIDNSVIPKAALSQKAVELTSGVHKMVVELYGGGDFGAPTLRAGLVSRDTIVDPYALALAKKADVVVIGTGFTADSETEGSDRGFELPVGQDDLIREVSAVNKNTVVTIISGGSVDVSGWHDRVAGLFELWYPGQQGGQAFARLLAGDVSPSGRLPISWEEKLEDNPSSSSYWYTDPQSRKVPYSEGVFVGYRGFDKKHVAPLFPFGFGLSYTQFEYSNLKVVPSNPEGHYKVSVRVKNRGNRAGTDVVQLYVQDPLAQAENAPQELKAFARVDLRPEEEQTVELELDPRSFTHYNVSNHLWQAKAGKRSIRVGSNERNLPLEESIDLPQITK
jgi:beta-glucosidase